MIIDHTISAIVTGGASGLGRASALTLANSGARVAIFDIDEEAGAALAQQIGGVFFKVDITDESSVLAGFEAARLVHGQERVLVHCAVVSGGGKTVGWDKQLQAFKRMPTSEFARSIDGIATASYRVASIAALGMASAELLNEDGERGAIVLTSSVASHDGQVGQVAYGGGKGAVNAMVLPMARDLMDLGIRVNAILPGTFETPPMLKFRDFNSDMFDALNAAVPFPKRFGKPHEFASLVMELIRNAYFNGQCLRLDGAIRFPPK